MANGKVQFIELTYTDYNTGQTWVNDRMATFSIFTERLTTRQYAGLGVPERIFSVNYFNLERQAEILLPMAISYSTGLINHFFQYRLGVQELPQPNDQPSKWRVTNLSNKVLTANLSVYYDSTGGTRKAVSGANYGQKTIQPNQSIDLTKFTQPADASGDYIFIASSSRHGENIGLAGKQFSYMEPVPTVPCGSTINGIQGGSEGFSPPPVNLGNQSGTVEVIFEAYYIPDAMTVRRYSDNGVLSTTNGLVSGYHRKTFQHNPDPDHASTHLVKLKVTGNDDTNTLWDVTLGCPGEGMPDKRKTVYFKADGEGTCNADLYIDGKYQRKIYSYGGSFSAKLLEGTHQVEIRNPSPFCQIGVSADTVSISVLKNGSYQTLADVFFTSKSIFVVD